MGRQSIWLHTAAKVHPPFVCAMLLQAEDAKGCAEECGGHIDYWRYRRAVVEHSILRLQEGSSDTQTDHVRY